jgi:hypothetical protein
MDVVVENKNIDLSSTPAFKLGLQVCRGCAKLSFVRQTCEPTNFALLGFGEWTRAHRQKAKRCLKPRGTK